jgi:hypothetical protein
MKYLKINDNTFLFNVVDDPLERANLKTHKPEVYSKLVQDCAEWEKTMLSLDPAAKTLMASTVASWLTIIVHSRPAAAGAVAPARSGAVERPHPRQSLADIYCDASVTASSTSFR